MNIGRTIRVLHAEPVGDPRAGDWTAGPPARQDGVTAEGAGDAADQDAGTVTAAGPPRE